MTFDIIGSRRLIISANCCIFCSSDNFILASGWKRNRFTVIRRIFLEYKSRTRGWSQKSNKATSLSSGYPDNKVKAPTSHPVEATTASPCVVGACCDREESQHRAGCQMPLASIQWCEGKKKSHPHHIIYAMVREKGELTQPEAGRIRRGGCCGSMPSEPVPSEL